MIAYGQDSKKIILSFNYIERKCTYLITMRISKIV